MSELIITFALFATFASVMCGAAALEASSAERRRTLRLLEAQVESVGANLWDEELSRSLVERVFFPLAKGMGGIAIRLTPIGMLKRIERKLVYAGSPAGWDAERVAAFKLMGLVAGVGFGLLVGLEGSSGTAMMMTSFFGFVGFAAPDALLSGAAHRRQHQIQKSLPDTLDLLTISVEAGLGFDAALAHVINQVSGPLSQEIGRMLQEVQLGMSRSDALRRLAERTDVDELRGFVLAIIQANVFGIGVGRVLRAQARELRIKRRQRAERKAMQTPVKILFPLIFCVLPALFVVVIGPGIIRIMENLFANV